jgi:putative transposase
MDLFELPVLVRTIRGQEVHLWLAVVLDCFSRSVVGWAVGDRNHGLVLSALGDAIRRSEGGVGGIPEVLRPDNGLEFTADAVREAAQDLGFTIAPTRAYSPHLKGKIERLGRTIKQEALIGLPFHRREPRSAEDKPYTDQERFQAPLDTLVIAKLDAFFDHYNWHRPHSSLLGRAPGTVWIENAHDVVEPTPAQLRRYLLRGIRRRVTKKGVRHHNLHFVAPELNRLVGTDVEARVYPHDDRQIEVYVDGTWLCTAYPSDAASEEQREVLFEQRRRDHDQARQLRTVTNRRKRAHLEPRNTPRAATDTTTPSQSAATKELRRHRGSRRAVDRLPDALGLGHRLNKPHNPQED